jgi:putative DNA primase/helicase
MSEHDDKTLNLDKMLLQICSNEPGTPNGNVNRFLLRRGADFLHTKAGWRHWTGTHWSSEDAEAHLLAAVRNVMARIADETALIADADEAEKRHAWCVRSQYDSNIKQTTKYLTGADALHTDEASFDAHPHLLSFSNGTLELRLPTGEEEEYAQAHALATDGTVLGQLPFRPHAPADRLTRVLDVRWDPAQNGDDHCPTWRAALRRWTGGDNEVAAYLQQLAGYALAGFGSEKAMIIAFGPTDSGKSMFLRGLLEAFGHYGTSLSTEALLEKRFDDDRHTDLVCLLGARLAVAFESKSQKQTFDSAILKKLTSGGIDGVPVRRMRENFVELRNRALIVLATNELPKVADFDESVWNRIKLAPFPHSIPKAEQVDAETLLSRLHAEKPGIIEWAVEGYLAWRESGCHLQEPETVRLATAKYRRDEDWLGRFLSDCTETSDGARINTKTLRTTYESWCVSALETPVSRQQFGKELAKRGISSQVSNSTRYYPGLRLREDAPTSEGDHLGPLFEHATATAI